MNAIMVCVDYSDIAAITIPYNRHHFDRLCVVSHPRKDPLLLDTISGNKCEVFWTDSFYSQGATFNKWRALEEGLDHFHLREPGWLCIMDADVLWPNNVDIYEFKDGSGLQIGIKGDDGKLRQRDLSKSDTVGKGQFCSPLRRMWNEWPQVPEWARCISGQDWESKEWNMARWRLPREDEWVKFPIHRNVAEWAGYSQIFHTSDPVLGPAPWHDLLWKHAGGADSAFQAKWAPQNKIRPPFEVLHLGPAGQNWYGRATPYADGSLPQGRDERLREIDEIWRGRTTRRQTGQEPFGPEKLP